MRSAFFTEVPGGRRCRARRRRQSIPADPACDSEVVDEGAPVGVVGGARKDSLAVRETGLSVILPGVPSTGEERRAIKSSIIVLILGRRRVVLPPRGGAGAGGAARRVRDAMLRREAEQQGLAPSKLLGDSPRVYAICRPELG